MAIIFPVIMSGGSGTRLWPLSRKALPKQYLDLVGDGSLFSQTVTRMSQGQSGRDAQQLGATTIICGHDHRDPIRGQLGALGLSDVDLILEPFGRNTAVVACIAALHTQARDPEGLVLLAPADHYIADVPGFWHAVSAGEEAAMNGSIVTLGIQPTKPHTGFGYIRAGTAISGSCHRVAKFEEKPELEKAKAFLESGDYYWNAGIFLFKATAMLEELRKHAPDVLAKGFETYQSAERSGMDIALPAEIFDDCPNISIDFAVMEKTDAAAIVCPVDIGWDDVGSWTALKAIKALGDEANTIIGDAVLHDCCKCYVHNGADSPLIALVGLDDMVVVSNGEAVLVAPADRAEEVKAIVEHLKSAGRDQLL